MNNGVKTKKVVKRRLKLKGALFLLCLVLILFFGIKTALKIEVSSVDVEGNKYLKASEVIKLGRFNTKTYYFRFSGGKACKSIKNNPLISTCKIKRKMGFKVEIDITENTPLFYYSTDSEVVLSDNTRVKDESITGIPMLINMVPKDILDEFASGLSKIDNDIIRSISEIEYTPSMSKDGKYIDKERFVLSMNDGNTIYINNTHLDTLSHYKKVYASIGDKKGTFEFDCDFGNYLFTEYGD